MQNEKKKLSVALQNQKNCMVYAIAVCMETKEFAYGSGVEYEENRK